jgi:hypothetical protein
MHPTGPAMNDLTPQQITFAVDWLGREVILVPDPIAKRMELERRNGWQECRGFAWGQSRPFPPDTWMHQVITTLVAAYAAAPIPDTHAGRDRQDAEADRHWADRWGELRATVVGEGDFDPDTRHWRNFPASADLHVFGWASKDPNVNHAYRLAG